MLAWQSLSGPHDPGAGSGCCARRACTRRFVFRVSCFIGVTHILKVSQSVAVVHTRFQMSSQNGSNSVVLFMSDWCARLPTSRSFCYLLF